MKRTFALAFGIVTVIVLGCASESAVEGKITYQGKPVDAATVTFMSEDGTIIGAAETDGTGHFKLRTAQGKDKIPAGTYKVVVMKTDAPPVISAPDPADAMKMMMKSGKASKTYKSAIPEKYTSAKTTSLLAKVPNGGPIELKLD